MKKKKIIAAGLSILIVASSSSSIATSKLVKRSPYEYQQIFTSTYIQNEESTSYIETDTNQNVENPISNQQRNDNDINHNNDSDQVLDEFKAKLDKICADKKFDGRTAKCLSLILNQIYENYETLDYNYASKNRLSKDEYIDDFLDTLINDVNSIVFVGEKSDPILKKQLDYAQGRLITDEGKILLSSELSDSNQVTVCLHEAKHTKQKGILSSYFVSSGFKNIFTEGAASFSSTNLSSTLQFHPCINDYIDSRSYYVNGPGDGCNLLYSKYYYMLGYLAGFDALQLCNEMFNNSEIFDIETEEIAKEIICNSIENNYDLDGSKILDLMLYSADDNHKFDSMKETIEAENLFCIAFKQDIDKIDSRESAMNALNRYRYYKMQYGIRCYDDNNKEVMLDMYTDIENLLFNKILDYGVLPNNFEKPMYTLLLHSDSFDSTYSEEISIENLSCFIDNTNIILGGKNNHQSKIYNLSTGEITTNDEDTYSNNNLIYSSNVKSISINR